VILTVDISIDQIVNCSIPFNLNDIDGLEVPISKNEQLEELLGEVLNSEADSNFRSIIGFDFNIKLLEVLSLRIRVGGVLPQLVQRNQQLTGGV